MAQFQAYNTILISADEGIKNNFAPTKKHRAMHHDPVFFHLQCVTYDHPEINRLIHQYNQRLLRRPYDRS